MIYRHKAKPGAVQRDKALSQRIGGADIKLRAGKPQIGTSQRILPHSRQSDFDVRMTISYSLCA
jgi:hypothetical protein